MAIGIVVFIIGTLECLALGVALALIGRMQFVLHGSQLNSGRGSFSKIAAIFEALTGLSALVGFGVLTHLSATIQFLASAMIAGSIAISLCTLIWPKISMPSLLVWSLAVFFITDTVIAHALWAHPVILPGASHQYPGTPWPTVLSVFAEQIVVAWALGCCIMMMVYPKNTRLGPQWHFQALIALLVLPIPSYFAGKHLMSRYLPVWAMLMDGRGGTLVVFSQCFGCGPSVLSLGELGHWPHSTAFFKKVGI